MNNIATEVDTRITSFSSYGDLSRCGRNGPEIWTLDIRRCEVGHTTGGASPIANGGHLVLSHANRSVGAERHSVTRINAEHSLVRALGVWGLAASIVNITVGGGIFRLPASA